MSTPPRPLSEWLLKYLLPTAFVVITGLVIFRTQQLDQWVDNPPVLNRERRQLAERFELADHHRHLVKFERYLGRQRVVLVFFDAKLGADGDPRTQSIIENYAAYKRAGIEVVAVSTATPFANGETELRLGGKVPFPLLTDIGLNSPIPIPTHQKWGAIEPETKEPRPGLYLIERDGTVEVDATGVPIPVEDEAAALQSLAEGQWPE